eukprot:g12221.t1
MGFWFPQPSCSRKKLAISPGTQIFWTPPNASTPRNHSHTARNHLTEVGLVASHFVFLRTEEGEDQGVSRMVRCQRKKMSRFRDTMISAISLQHMRPLGSCDKKVVAWLVDAWPVLCRGRLVPVTKKLWHG